tara:strand:- start:3688 stop:4104 length:417 start_codon:yes stop_codon:yes gene_type:complete
MNKLVIMFILVLSLSIVSAQDNYYNLDSGDDFITKKTVVKTSHSKYLDKIETISLNNKRYSTYDYRHGYTYRTTKEFKENYKKKYKNYKLKDYWKWDNKDHYHKYRPFKRDYLKVECYHKPPKGKWIYRRCPGHLIVE